MIPQRLQLERQAQAQAPERQAESLADQRDRLLASTESESGANAMGDEAQRILTKAANVVTGARILRLVAVPIAASLPAFACWAPFCELRALKAARPLFA